MTDSAAARPTDVVVVGAGILGLMITRALAATGRTVTCIGPDHRAPGTASSAAGAMLGTIGEVTGDDMDAVDAVELDFRATAAKMWPGIIEELADVGGAVRHGTGTMMVANLVNESDRANLATAYAAAAKVGIPAEQVDPQEVPGLRPARGYEAVAAMFLPTEGWLDTVDLLDRLRAGLAADQRVTLMPTQVVGVTPGPNPVVRLSDGTTVTAGDVVLAAGVGCRDLLAQLDGTAVALPQLLPGKGISLELAEAPTVFPYVVRTPNRDFACGTHVVPRPDGRVYLGATNRVSATPARPRVSHPVRCTPCCTARSTR
ncbi:hypothetical protein GCM10029963_24410 [Micromonospora andamanensis]